VHFEDCIFWWESNSGVNFGDDLSRVIVEKILGHTVKLRSVETDRKLLLALGSILHYARNDDVIWGSGFRENPLLENRFDRLDVRCVRGPRTREFLIKMG
jgi:pyruvyltransferase